MNIYATKSLKDLRHSVLLACSNPMYTPIKSIRTFLGAICRHQNGIRSSKLLLRRLPSHSTTIELRNMSMLNNVFIIHRHFSNDKSINTAEGAPKLDFDEFRAREEKKEEEYSKQETSEESSEPEESEKIDDVRVNILNASLPFVGSCGWTRLAIAQGAESVGFPGVAHGMFPDGGIELIRHFYANCNKELLEYMKKETDSGRIISSNPQDFIYDASKYRLQMIEPYITHWPQALALMSLPQNVPTSLAQLLTMIDDICFFSGDRSVDFSWYTRRIVVATIYKLTELYMLQDSSLQHQQTWAFLKTRMEEAFYVQQIISDTEKMGENAQKVWNSAFLTARNILGLDFKRR